MKAVRLALAPIVAVVLAAVLAVPLATPLDAQAPPMPDLARHRAEVEKLAWMVGTWEGEAWHQRGPQRTEIVQKETVALRLDGLAILIEGEGRSKTAPDQVLFRALGVVAFDEAVQGLRLSTWTGEGRGMVTHVDPTETGFTWGFEVPQGVIRYTITRGDGTWHEIGEFTADGAAWNKFFEMTLKKTG